MTAARDRQSAARSNAPPPSVTARRALIVLAVAALALLVWQLSDALLLLFGAIVLASALRSLAHPLCTYLPLSARVAVLTTVLLLAVLLVGGSWVVGGMLAEQLDSLRERIPTALSAFSAWISKQPLGAELVEMWKEARQGGVAWGRVANIATSTLGALGSAALVVILAVYFAVDPDQYRKGFVRLIPRAYRSDVDAALGASGEALSKWLTGQGISMLFVGSSTAIGLALLGMPLALALGVIAGVLAFVPFFGPIASGVLAVLLAFTEGPNAALYVALLMIAIQQIEGNVLMPLVQRWAVALPPVLGITAAVVFGVMFGTVGVLFATPLMVVLMVLVQKLYVEGILESRDAGG